MTDYETVKRLTKRRIYLDLDGVMADFDRHYPALFGHSHKDENITDDEMWANIIAHKVYFQTMPLCPGAKEFYDSIEHLEPTILTACPKGDYENAALQKREWVRLRLSPLATVLPVLGGRRKYLFMHQPGDILIDDYGPNLEPWVKAGGIGILHRNFEETIHRLNLIIAQD